MFFLGSPPALGAVDWPALSSILDLEPRALTPLQFQPPGWLVNDSVDFELTTSEQSVHKRN